MHHPATDKPRDVSAEELRQAAFHAAAAAALADTLPRAGVNHRIIAAAVAAVAWLPLILAASMTPDPAGHGTHTQLGLPACNSMRLTGYPCPSCGMTTAFAEFVRGDLPAALRAQVFGTVLAALTLLTAIGATLTAATGANLGPVVSRILYSGRWWAYLLAGLALGSWGLKIWLSAEC